MSSPSPIHGYLCFSIAPFGNVSPYQPFLFSPIASLAPTGSRPRRLSREYIELALVSDGGPGLIKVAAPRSNVPSSSEALKAARFELLLEAARDGGPRFSSFLLPVQPKTEVVPIAGEGASPLPPECAGESIDGRVLPLPADEKEIVVSRVVGGCGPLGEGGRLAPGVLVGEVRPLSPPPFEPKKPLRCCEDAVARPNARRAPSRRGVEEGLLWRELSEGEEGD